MKGILWSLFCMSAVFHFPRPNALEFLGTSIDILYYLRFHLLCFAGIKASGFWMIVILCPELWSCLSWVVILLIGFSAFSGSRSVMGVIVW